MTAILVPTPWKEVAHRRADIITSRWWAKRKSLAGFVEEDPWTRRQRGMVAEVGVALYLGHIELWNPNLVAFHGEPDVFPNFEVRSGQFYTRGEGDRGKPDPEDAWIIQAKVSLGDMVDVIGWAPRTLFIEEGQFFPRDATWDQDRWVLDPDFRRFPSDAQEAIGAWWDAIPERAGGATLDRWTMRERFWNAIEATPLVEAQVARQVMALKRKPVAHRERAVNWAEGVLARGEDFPSRTQLERAA